MPDPIKPATPAPKVIPAKAKSEQDTIHEELQKILKEFDEQESNIPVTHRYWDLRNRYQYLAKGGK